MQKTKLVSKRGQYGKAKNKAELHSLISLTQEEAAAQIQEHHEDINELCATLRTSPVEDGSPDNIKRREEVFGENIIPRREPKTILQPEVQQDIKTILWTIAVIVHVGLPFFVQSNNMRQYYDVEADTEDPTHWIKCVVVVLIVLCLMAMQQMFSFPTWSKEKLPHDLRNSS